MINDVSFNALYALNEISGNPEKSLSIYIYVCRLWSYICSKYFVFKTLCISLPVLSLKQTEMIKSWVLGIHWCWSETVLSFCWYNPVNSKGMVLSLGNWLNWSKYCDFMLEWKSEHLFTSALAKYDYNYNNYIKNDQQIWMHSYLAERTFKKSMK